MIKRWRFIAAGIVAITLGFLFVNNVQAKYIDSKTLTVSVNIEKHYEVAFNANGGTGTMSNQQFTVGTAQTLTANAYTYADHYFDGWNTAADGSGTPYTDEELISADLTNIGGSTVTLYAQWEEEDMHTAFKITGECIFHGYDMQQNVNAGYITGTNCSFGGTDWADGTHRYIDTGIKLYDSTNYSLDYEVGFTITAYDPDHQYQEPNVNAIQSTFFNAKLENSARHWPGITVRKSTDKVEITETITKPNGAYKKEVASVASTTPIKVVIARVDGIVYYSVNDSAFTALQDINGTSDYFDVTAWFGAAAKDDGTPMRYIDATMTDIYIKLGDAGANKHIVSFDAGGVTTNPSNVTVISSSKMGSLLPSMPTYVDTATDRLYFNGWYTGANGTGDKYDADTIVTRDLTLYAYWDDTLRICELGDGTIHGSLQECIDAAATGDTITLLDNIKTHVTVASGKEFTLDLNSHTFENDKTGGTATPAIQNGGKLTVINGTITSSAKAGVINNTNELYVGNDARILATGIRQTVYNDGGKLVISGNAYLSATSYERATVQSLGSSSQVTITGGTIISALQEAVKIEAGTLTIGVQDGTIDSSTPILQGATYGLNTSVNVSMFDGRLRGETAAINNTARITTTETGATPVGINPVATEVVDGVTYQIIYYQ